jgi:hypothetical protein
MEKNGQLHGTAALTPANLFYVLNTAQVLQWIASEIYLEN